jgi:hypothetical protein
LDLLNKYKFIPQTDTKYLGVSRQNSR